ncbi:MAG: hypothetical protein KOO60_06400 [Gemmatimonadales bacterium]|nr:hypothetical protein [Gemmatimonadales bacterium]
MPREMARQSAWQDTASTSLSIQVKQVDRTVRVTLSGTFDQPGMERLVAQVAPRLGETGCRIILEGINLTHLDYRVTPQLIRWNRMLGQFRHQLFLQGWNDYLKAILCMEDWDGELAGRPAGDSQWRVLDNILLGRRS